MPTYYIRETRTTETLIIVDAASPEDAFEKYLRQDYVTETVTHDRVEDAKAYTLDGFLVALPR